jgi:hypothetical protein
LPAGLGEGRAPRTSCTLVHVQGRYAIALVLDGVVLCTVPVGPMAEELSTSAIG